MDFKKWNEQAHEADNFLETLGKTLWKRKWLLLFLGFCWVVYWAFTQPAVEETTTQTTETTISDVWTFDLDENGDTLWYLNNVLQEP